MNQRPQPARILPAIALAVAGMLTATAVHSQDVAGTVNDYFWPAQRDALEYRVRSHALRGSLSVRRSGEVTIGGQTWQEATVSSQRVPSLNETVWLRADETGIYTRYSKSPDAKVVHELIWPARVGASWATINRDGSPTRRKIEGVGECSLRGATFDHCVRVSFSSARGQSLAVFAAGMGEIVSSQDNGFRERSLVPK